MVRKRVLGRTGFEVAEIGLGAWPIGGGNMNYGAVSEKDAHAIIGKYIALGGNFIDTARTYGKSERILGDFFQRNGGREQVFIASKTWELEPTDIRNDLEHTLRQLRSDYVDIYYLHSPPDDPAEMSRVLDVYEQLRQEGKIRAIGASIKGPDVTQRTVDLCRQYIRSECVDVLLVIYSIFRQKNSEMLQEAVDAGVGVVARTVLESGFLSGEYGPGFEFTGQDHRRRWDKERLRTILQEAHRLRDSVLAPPYETLSQMAIRFALDRQSISSVVVGAMSTGEVNENVKAASLPSLGEELRERLVDMYSARYREFNTS
jgi:aryl-alcohol dehydrogenase-like predicted oxidoreductase